MADHSGRFPVRVNTPDAVGDAWDRALAADRPVVYEAVTDPNVPPLPPHISWEQAKNFIASIYHGDADALGFIKQTVKDAVESYLPNKR
jgi:pyruvate dehydrogenase (quinone)